MFSLAVSLTVASQLFFLGNLNAQNSYYEIKTPQRHSLNKCSISTADKLLVVKVHFSFLVLFQSICRFSDTRFHHKDS